MIECETKLKRWGNSIGFIIPKGQAENANLRPNQVVRAVIKPKETVRVRDIFGKLKIRRSTRQIMEEVRETLDSKYS